MLGSPSILSIAMPPPGNHWRSLLAEIDSTRSPADFRRLLRAADRLRSEIGPPEGAHPATFALLGAATLDLLENPLRLALLARGIDSTLHRAPYGVVGAELLDAESETSQLAPDLALVVVTSHDIPEWPKPGTDSHAADELARRVARFLLEPCASLHERCGTEVILTNFPPLSSAALGNLEARLPEGRENFIRRVNLALGDLAPGGVHLCDVAGLAARAGADHWSPGRFWYEAKLPFGPQAVRDFVHSVGAMAAGLLGRSRKCLVLDLDNTLWGGAIGEDGLEGIDLGEGTPRGEAFKAFQLHLRALRNRGLILAVCSKNEEANARLPFERHPECVLALDDFVAFHASWDAKSDRIRAIAAELDLGLDSLVFFDDDPAEREQVGMALPQVAVVEVPPDPCEYPGALDAGRWFEVPRITPEDRARSAQYHHRAQARALEKTLDLSDFLAALEMRAVVAPIDELSLSRVAQLVNKTNQFNLTTRRMTLGEVAQLTSAESWITRTVRLADRFGDHGIISVATIRVEGRTGTVEDWLMSCRVLKRGVERMLLNELVDACRERALHELYASFRPTGRNQLVQDLCTELGFTRIGEERDRTLFKLSVEEFEPLDHFVSEVVRAG